MVRNIQGKISMKYTVVIKASDEGYSIACPALPGCWSQGKTEEEAITNISEAIQDYLGRCIRHIQKGALSRD